MKKPLLLLSLSLLLVSSCGDQKIDTTKARQEMEAREIKKVSEGEIIEKTLQIGNNLSEAFAVALSADGQYGLVNTTKTKEKVGFIHLNDVNTYTGKRFQMLDAYAYNAENGLASEPGVQILEGDTLLFYTKPAYNEGEPVGVYFIEFKRKSIVLSIEK